MRRLATGAQWLARQNRDEFVRAARDKNYRCRSAFKLLQLDSRYNIFGRSPELVIDIGAAPGGWSQVALERGARKVIGVDLQTMAPISEMFTFLQGNFMNLHDELGKLANGSKATAIISDMAPNMTGIKDCDHALSVDLVRSVLQFTRTHLRKNGNAIAKLLSGQLDTTICSEWSACFSKVQLARPDATRRESREVFIVAQNYKGEQIN